MSWSILKKCHGFWLVLYLKRGVNDRGRVANDVETEQIVLDEEAGSRKGKMSSVVQMRVQRYDPTYEATKLHFEDLAKRYGNPIIVLNLIKFVALIVVQEFFAFMLLSIVDGNLTVGAFLPGKFIKALENERGFVLNNSESITEEILLYFEKLYASPTGESWSVEGLD
ncbi:Phosphoinositide phosphatase SAC1 [Vitis vinifera]|uniref:Phosphoinositide phosphatase SAC1 n=1 Tax=Vitis vinifera TaxID=29760 RepID=A0A438GZL4_VITVI|nr:Phosphoinositide phosphatase SAC1 [Vitis vinifera]